MSFATSSTHFVSGRQAVCLYHTPMSENVKYFDININVKTFITFKYRAIKNMTVFFHFLKESKRAGSLTISENVKYL